MNVMNLNTYDNGLYVGSTPIGYDVVLSGNKADFTFDTSNLMGSKVIVQNTADWFNNSSIKNLNISTELVDQNYSVQNSCNMFYNCQYLEHVEGFNFNNVVDGYNMFYNCHNLVMEPISLRVENGISGYMYKDCWNLVGSPVMDDNLINVSYMYWNCYNLTGSPVLGENVVEATYTYGNCRNLTGSPCCFDNVKNAVGTYDGCVNITGSPVIGSHVKNAYHMYYNCSNLDDVIVWDSKESIVSCTETFRGCTKLPGPPVCPEGANISTGMYHDCISLEGEPVVSDSVTIAENMYMNCRNLTGSPVIPPGAISIANMYSGCVNLSGSFTMKTIPISYYHAFEGCNGGLHLEVDPSLGKLLYNSGVPSNMFGDCKNYTAPKQYANGVYYQEVEFLNGGTLEWTAGYDRLMKRTTFDSSFIVREPAT